MKWVTVSDMYNNAKVAEAKLLSTFTADFWTEYKNHSDYYDRLFGRMFGSFRFFDQQPKKFYEDISTADITQVRIDFTDAVYDHLLVNSKKYEELYRVSQLTDANYPITTNYDITETKEETISKEGEEVSGERTDTTSTTHGAYEDSVTSVHGARTDSKSDTLGQRIDSKSDTLGQRTDSKSDTLGQRIDSKSDTLGQRTDEVTKAYAQHIDQTDETLGQRSDSHSVTQGAQSNSRETGIAGFNSNSYSDDATVSEQLGSRSDSSSDTVGQQINGREVTYGAHQDVDTTIQGSQSNSSSMTTGAQNNSSSVTIGAQNNSSSTTVGAQNNSSSITTGAHTDTVTDTKASRSISGSDVKGEQTDTFEHSISDEYTLRKVGNIGVKTVSEMLGEHIDLWTSYEFYRYIFKEICADLLLI